MAWKKGICKNGHLLTPENTYTASNGNTQCRQCTLARQNKRVNNNILYNHDKETQNSKYHSDENYRLKVNERNRNNWNLNKERYSITKNKWYNEEHQRVKEEIMKLCGNGQIKCVNCPIDDIDVLTIDHKNGRKEEERKTRDINKHHYGFSLWRKILSGKLDYKEYQTMCMNCNWKKHIIELRNSNA